MWLFIVSLAMVFATVAIAYVVVRLQLVSEGDWRPPDSPGVPRILILSTILLVASSGTLWQASRVASRSAGPVAVGRWMLLTVLLVAGFLASQIAAWDQLVEANLSFNSSLYAWLFYILTGIHALHVLGGLGPLVLTTCHAFKGRYQGAPDRRRGLTYCGMYWHFLDVAWILLYALLLWGMGG